MRGIESKEISSATILATSSERGEDQKPVGSRTFGHTYTNVADSEQTPK